MTKFDYDQSSRIASTNPSFTTLVMAAMRRASTTQKVILRTAFPAICMELDTHYGKSITVPPPDPDNIYNDAMRLRRG